jgi:trans-aconitate 2-methyltransferase
MSGSPTPLRQPLQESFVYLRPDSRVLDVGCGVGDLAAFLSRFVPEGEVLGVDNCPREILTASNRHPSAEFPNLQFLTADARSLMLKDQSRFDCVVCRNCLHIVPGAAACIPIVARWLKSGGRFHLWQPGIGFGKNLEACFGELAIQPEWHDYFLSFRWPWRLISPHLCAPWLTIARLRPYDCRLISEKYDFPSRGIFIQWLRWFYWDFWRQVPAYKHRALESDFIDIYLRSSPTTWSADLVWLKLEAMKM